MFIALMPAPPRSETRSLRILTTAIIQVACLFRKRHDVQESVPRYWPRAEQVPIPAIVEPNPPALTRESEVDNLATVTRKLLADIMRD